MTDEIKKLKGRADAARLLYKRNLITRDEARQDIRPFIEKYNEKAFEVAKKYGVNPKLLSFSSFLR